MLDFCLSHFRDDRMREVLLNGCRSVTFIRDGCRETKTSPFEYSEQLTEDLQDFAFNQGQRLDPKHPFAGGQLVRGGEVFRWHAVMGPASKFGPLFSLRRHRFRQLRVGDFLPTAEDEQQFLSKVRSKKYVFISGKTGAGKSSLLVALLEALCRDERILVLESLAEIPPVHPQWIHLSCQSEQVDGLGQVSFAQLFINGLRLLPDRMVIGEIRSEEAPFIRECYVSGHGPLWATVHGGCAEDGWSRISATLDHGTDQKSLMADSLVIQVDRPGRVTQVWAPQ